MITRSAFFYFLFHLTTCLIYIIYIYICGCAARVFVYWLGTEPFLYVSEPEFLKKVTSGSLSKSWGKPNVFKYDRRPMFGNGLVMVEGDEWDHHRHIIVPAFSIKNLNVSFHF